MRILSLTLGVIAVISYAVCGALTANDWAVTAASGHPLEQTIADMAAAKQGYSVIPGIAFAVIGSALGVAWAIFLLGRGRTLAPWAGIALWSAIIAAGAPAYWVASFGNLMSVGDTYVDWDAQAALRYEAPLYLASALAAIVLCTALTIGIIRWIFERRMVDTRPRA